MLKFFNKNDILTLIKYFNPTHLGLKLKEKNLNFHFHNSFWHLKGSVRAVKAFMKPLECEKGENEKLR